MKILKKVFSILSAALLATACILPLTACGSTSTGKVLRIFNSEDYIDPDLIEAFEEEYGVTVEYSTYGTMENMYNELSLNEGSYDLVCPSDYMLTKLINEGMVEKLTDDFVENSEYSQYVSPYIANVFEENNWTNYSAGYMWGTMGFMYNPAGMENLTQDITSWKVLESQLYKNKATLKDSVRDTYFYAVACVKYDELKALYEEYAVDGEIPTETQAEYNQKLTDIMNSTDAQTVEEVRKYLREIKKNIYGFEVDGGKNDMVTGKISINLCWSGDAAYAIWEAAYEEADNEDGEVRKEDAVDLYYTVPDYVSNVWIDCWAIPKGGQVELAQDFINFISRPENAIPNMSYIGYTSVISGGNDEADIFEDWVLDSYEVEEEEGSEEFEEMLANGEITLYDLSYFFTDDPEEAENYQFYAYVDLEDDGYDVMGQLGAQYPTTAVVTRCAVMRCFDTESDNRINMMWEDVKGAEIPLPAVIFIAVVVVVLVGAFLLSKYGNDWFHTKPKKGYYKVEK